MPESARSQEVQARLRTYRQSLASLLHSDAISTGDIEKAYRQVTELAAQLLGVERASVWRLDSLNTELRCTALYERSTGAISSGQVILAKVVPRYFAALAEERCLVADDAHQDPRTAGFSESYLTPLGIGAMLDAPIWVSGRMVGVVCHEHVGGPREWDLHEELLAGTVADFVARVIEASDRLRAERVLGQYRKQVHDLVGILGKEREHLNRVLARKATGLQSMPAPASDVEETRRVFDASPVPLVITRLEDAEVRYVNARAAELFDIPASDVTGQRAPDFYVDAADRAAFLEELRSSGRVDGFVAQLKTPAGRRFWALMSAACIPYQGDACFMVGFSDVTAQKVAELAVREGAQRLRTLFAAAPVPLILSRIADRQVVLANQRAADLFEVPLDEVVGERTPDYYLDSSERDRLVQKLMQDGHAESGATRLRTRTGRVFWGTISARVLDFEDQSCFLVGVHDVTPQKELEEQLRELATRDALTTVFNRRHFMELAERERQRALRTGAPLAVCTFDADHFKQVNDAHGHAVGDQVLVAIARAAEGQLRAADVLARVGGEEFEVLLPDTDAEGAAHAAERILTAIRQVEIPVGGDEPLRPTVSIGVATYAPGEKLESLLRRADDALYRAKQEGRDRVVTT